MTMQKTVSGPYSWFWNKTSNLLHQVFADFWWSGSTNEISSISKKIMITEGKRKEMTIFLWNSLPSWAQILCKDLRWS